MVIILIVYVDIVIIVNFLIDLIILIFLNRLLKRNEKKYRFIISALIGEITIIVMFVPFSSIQLLLFKLLTAVLMILISFGYKSFKYFINNLTYFYILSCIIGGVLYLFNLNKSFNYSYIYLLLIPGILNIYCSFYRNNINNNKRYNLKILFKNNKNISLVGFIDTGNKLKDPYFNRPIILVEKKFIEHIPDEYVLVPYNALNFHGLLKCLVPKKVIIDDINEVDNVLIGISERKFNIDGVNCILNSEIMEEKYV